MITYNEDKSIIEITDTNLLTFYNYPSSYQGLDIEATYNGVTSSSSVTQITTTTTDPIYYDEANEVFVVNPSLFELSEFTEGVYNIVFLLRTSSSTIRIEFCLFINIDMKCKIMEYYDSSNIDIDFKHSVLSAYYVLDSDSMCDCQCDKYYDIYKFIDKVLANSNCRIC